MGKEICPVCGREIDSRGMSGHMRSHKGKIKLDDNDGVISYPSNEQEIEEKDTVVDLDDSPSGGVKKTPVKKQVKTPVKKQVKKRAASKPASSSTSKPDAGGEDKPYHKSREWQGFFRD